MFVAARGQARPRRRQRHGEQRGALQVRLVAADAHCAMSATSDGARPCRAGAARLPILPWRRFLRPRKTNYLPRPGTGSPQLASCWGACGTRAAFAAAAVAWQAALRGREPERTLFPSAEQQEHHAAAPYPLKVCCRVPSLASHSFKDSCEPERILFPCADKQQHHTATPCPLKVCCRVPSLATHSFKDSREPERILFPSGEKRQRQTATHTHTHTYRKSCREGGIGATRGLSSSMAVYSRSEKVRGEEQATSEPAWLSRS